MSSGISQVIKKQKLDKYIYSTNGNDACNLVKSKNELGNYYSWGECSFVYIGHHQAKLQNWRNIFFHKYLIIETNNLVKNFPTVLQFCVSLSIVK